MIDQTQTTLYPGGILNTGFAVSWAQDRVHDAEPASPGGQPWNDHYDGTHVDSLDPETYNRWCDFVSRAPAGCRPGSCCRWCRAWPFPPQPRPCPGVRGEPCRDYQPFTNRPAGL